MAISKADLARFTRVGRSIRRKPAPRRSAPPRVSPTFARPLGDAAAPIKKAAVQARHRTVRARRAVPRAPSPALPVLRHPTRAQDKAVARLTVASVKRNAAQAPRGTSIKDKAALERSYLQDARSGKRGAAIRGASQRLDESRALRALHQVEAQRGTAGGSRSQRVAAGEALLRASVSPSQIRAGGAPRHRVGIGPASINASALTRPVLAAVRKGDGVALARFLGHDVPGFAGRAGKDAISLPQGAVLGTYELGKAGVALAHGDTKPARKIAGTLDDGALGRLVVHGDPKGALKAFGEHPLYSVLDVTGAGSVLGRTAGAGLRVGGRLGREGNVLARAGSTKRADLTIVEGTNQRVARAYSKNAIVKGGQVVGERIARRQGFDPNQARGFAQKHHMRGEVDEFAGQAEGMGRRGRDEMGAAAKGLAPKRKPGGKRVGKVERELVFAATERRLRGPATFKEDLLHERARLQKVYVEGRLAPDARQANRAQARAFDRALNDPRVLANAEEVFRAADEATAHTHAIERGKIAERMLDPRQAEISKVRPYAVSHMGAKPMDDATAARLVGESRGRTAGASTAHADARDAHVAALRADKETRLVEAYQRSKDPAVPVEQRAVAKKAAVRLAGELDVTPAQVRRLAARGVPDVAVARRVAVAARQHADDQHAGLPAREQAHAAALGEHQVAVRDVAAAEKRAAVAARQRSEAIGTQRSQRARGAKVSPARRDRAERRLAAAKADLSDARKRVRAAEKRAADTEPGRRASGLQDEHGQPLLTDEIVAHMDANGVPTPGFLSQRRDQIGAKAYFQNFFPSRKTADSKGRTGEATRQGSYDSNFQALTDNLVGGTRQLDVVRQFDDFIGRFGSKDEKGNQFTWDEATREAEVRGSLPGGVKWVPVRSGPARYSEEAKAAIAEGQDASSGPHIGDLMVSRFEQARQAPVGKAAAKERNVVLVPEAQFKRFQDHQLARSLPFEKAFQKFSGLFRGAVLPLSTKWVTGNVVEGVTRLAIEGVSPADVWHGGRVMKELRKVDEEAWRAMDTRVKGGLLFGAGDRLTVRRGADDFEGSILHGPAKLGQAAGHSQGVKQVIAAVTVMQKGIFGVNRGLERAMQQGVIGKQARRDAEEITRGWGQLLVMQKSIVHEVAQGLTGTPKQVQYARKADAVLGKYSRFSPSTRRAIQAYAPFLPWFLNSAKFVGYTLPVKHPAKTALLASVEREYQRDWDEAGKDLPPGDLRYNPRNARGGVVNVARFTPFGAFTKGPEILADPLLPQISGAVAIVAGRNFTGNKLKVQDGTEPSGSKRAALALYSIMESTVFGAGLARRLQEGGESPFDDSTLFAPRTKPGSAFGAPSKTPVVNAANRVFNPVKPTYLSDPTGGGGSGPVSRRDQMLERRAARIEESQAGGGRNARRELMLERRAARIEARGG